MAALLKGGGNLNSLNQEALLVGKFGYVVVHTYVLVGLLVSQQFHCPQAKGIDRPTLKKVALLSCSDRPEINVSGDCIQLKENSTKWVLSYNR